MVTKPVLPGESILNMAEAMLGDEYKLSHTNLSVWNTESSGALDGLPIPQENTGNTITNNHTRDILRPIAKRPEGRSVSIQAPQKRQKLQHRIYTPTEVVTALHGAVSQEQRQNAVNMALSTFDHDDKMRHDAEINAGADVALVKMLAFLEFKTGFRRKPIKANLEEITVEISQVCKAIEMMYRASSHVVGESFQRVGTDLLQTLVILIDEEVKRRMKTITPETSPFHGPILSTTSLQKQAEGLSSDSIHMMSAHGDEDSPEDRNLLLNKAAKILGHYARVGKATKALAHFPGLLGSTLNLINMQPFDSFPWEARLSCLWTLANLACNPDNMTMMICTPGLLNSIVSIGYRQVEPTHELQQIMEVLRARSIASRALLNLSWSPRNKIAMADNAAVVNVLCQMGIQRSSPIAKSHTMREIACQTRRHAIGALRNLSSASKRSKLVLAQCSAGKVLTTLADAAMHDNDQKVVELSFACIENLAVADTAELILDHPILPMVLKNALDGQDARDDKESPKGHAAATVLVLERSITPDMTSHGKMKELFASKWSKDPMGESGLLQATNTVEL